MPDNLAETFSGGRYTEEILKENTILYRAGTRERPFGQFFEVNSPEGIIKSRIDKAILPNWSGGGTSPINASIPIEFPTGTKIYRGAVSSQGGFYIGGSEQIIVLKPWEIQGAKIIEKGIKDLD